MSKLIAEGEKAEYKRWQVPDVTPGVSRQDRQGSNKYLTAVQLEKIQKQAHEEAYARGLREGIAAGQAQMKEKAKHFVGLVNLLERPLKEADEAVESELLLLCMAIAKQIIRREIGLDSGHVVAVIREAIAALPVMTQKLRICLHPDDAAVARAALADSGEAVSWTIAEDLSLTRGDCKIFTEFSQVDATLDKRLAIIATKLTGGERASDKSKR